MTTVDVLIAGAGIIGLSCALELRKHGCRVAVLERGRSMHGASWAAAGMLAAHDAEKPAALLPLAHKSLALYGAFLDRIRALSGQAVPLRTTTAVQAMASEAPITPSRKLLSAVEAQALIPGLATARYRFAALDELSLDPRDLCHALPLAATAAGVAIHEHAAVQCVLAAGNAVEVRTSDGLFSAGAFLNCCGAWSSQLSYPGDNSASSSSESRVPVFPRKGQMAVVRVPPAALPVVLRSPEVYLVPRGDGRVVVGASVEDAGFDTTVHSATLRELIENAAALWPLIADAPVIDSWAGLRPGTQDGLPLLGALPTPHCFVATGHFRNGILLAPATAEAMASLMTGRTPAMNLAAYTPDRFLLSRAM